MGILLRQSSVAKKFVMAVTGGALVLFLLFHAIMNVVAIFSPQGYEQICTFLGANWYAVAASIVLGLLIVVHFVYSFILSFHNARARGRVRYAKKSRHDGSRWATRNMLVIGIFVILALTLHLYDFWYHMQWAELTGGEAVKGVEQLKFIFSNNYFSIMYLLWLGTLWIHLSHGVSSVMQSIGWNSLAWERIVMGAGRILAALIILCFVSVVLYFWLFI